MLTSFVALVLAQSAPIFNVEPTPDGVRLVTQVNGLPQELSNLKIGAVKDVLRHGTVIYVALGTGGVVVIDAANATAPVVTARLAEGQQVVQLAHEGASTLVAILEDHGALNFNAADPLHPVPLEPGPAASGPPASGPPSPKPFGGKGKVLAVRDGTAVIEGGTAAGFYMGEHVKIVSRAHLSPQDQLAEQEGLLGVGTTTAIVTLERVEANRAVAHLGRGDEAQAEDEVFGTSEPISESVIGPRWIPFEWRVSFTLRPFLDTSDSSNAVGLLTDAMVAYYFAGAPLRVEAGVEPLGLAVGGGAQHNPAIAVADLAFTSPFLEFGIGTGFSVLAQGTTNFEFGGVTPNGSVVDPLIVEVLRIGQLDGLNLIWHSAIASTNGQGFKFRAAEADLNIPITSRLTIFLDGAGGDGYAFGDFGIRTYLGGVGGPGTTILSLGLGGASVIDGDKSFGGPSLLLGVEFRL
jgi:hypothetical protein